MSKYLSFLKKVLPIFLLMALFLPVVSSATTFGGLLTKITSTILRPMIGLLLTVAVVVFFWGMVKYIYSLGVKEKEEGRWLMIWGIIALFVMVSVWGLVNVLIDTLDLDNSSVPGVIPASSGGILQEV